MHSRTWLPARANSIPSAFAPVARPFAPGETAGAQGSGHEFANVAVSAGVIQRSSDRVRMVGLDRDEELDEDSGSGSHSGSVSEGASGSDDEQEEKSHLSDSDFGRESPIPQSGALASTPRSGVRSSFPRQGRAMTPQPWPSSPRVPHAPYLTPQPQNDTPIRKAHRRGLLSPAADRNPDIVGGRMHPTMRNMVRELTTGGFDRAMDLVEHGAREPMSREDVAKRQGLYKDPPARSADEGRAQLQAYHTESNALLQRLAAKVQKDEELTRDDNVALARMYGRGDSLLSRTSGPQRAWYPGRKMPAQIGAKMRRLQAISTLPMSQSAYGETQDAWATRVSSILSFRSLNVGTNVRTADLPKDAQASLRKFGQRSMSGKRYLVLAHGKNRHAGGRGDKALNLAPATPAANRQHSHQVEERLKALLFNGEVVGYDVRFPRRQGGGAAPAPAPMSEAEKLELAQMTKPQKAKYEKKRRNKQEVMAEERKLPVAIKYNLRRIEMEGQEPKATHRVAKGVVPSRIPTTEPNTLVEVRINKWDPRGKKPRKGHGWTRRKPKPAQNASADHQ